MPKDSPGPHFSELRRGSSSRRQCRVSQPPERGKIFQPRVNAAPGGSCLKAKGISGHLISTKSCSVFAIGMRLHPPGHRRSHAAHRDPSVSGFVALQQCLRLDFALIDPDEQVLLGDWTDAFATLEPSFTHVEPICGHGRSPLDIVLANQSDSGGTRGLWPAQKVGWACSLRWVCGSRRACDVELAVHDRESGGR